MLSHRKKHHPEPVLALVIRPLECFELGLLASLPEFPWLSFKFAADGMCNLCISFFLVLEDVLFSLKTR